MGPTRIGGLPAHPLLVHAVVTLVPLACVLVVVAALWPAARHRLGPVPPVLAVLGLIAVPPTTHAGEALEESLAKATGTHDPAIERHAHLGDQLLPWMVALVVVAVVAWAVQRRERVPAALRVVVPVVAVVVAVATAWMTYRIGDTGARAVWNGVGSS
ncbi:hypothetical protein EV189_0500 [Motilibacter rhizosphaerae]|uniref:DUF2231 domain-containing protein n=1 Tax=Motilibacter rhizosphaerae TaxID=598652 RepID=A0A4Q7NVI1_9ACTN|nr:DUF2231 domain-containing protein [Motilibacter rhizosphaerae]RZS91263.1 hypothetical protein EV189_0500 [Motilibacter rhizosphaerae]